MMLSESWCFEQKVQEKDGMEREKSHSFPWSNFCMVKKDMMVVSFNLVRCAGGLICAVCGMCCYTFPVGSWDSCLDCFVHCSVFAGKWVLYEKLSWTCLLIFEEHLICNVDISHYLEKFPLLAHCLCLRTCWY